jgi:hypothetical protein
MSLAKKLMDIDEKRAKTSYIDFKTRKCVNPGLSRQGMVALDYFFLEYRLRAKTKHGISFEEAMRSPKMIHHLTNLVKRWKKSVKIDYSNKLQLLKYQYSVFQLYYGTINQFRPAFAYWIYCQFSPKIGILDFSAGWGGRCLAAMALDVPYIGIDANKNLKKPYSDMIQLYEPSAKVSMYFQPSETIDFSRFNYDLVFTSPPYFMLEKYESMPEYTSNEDFLDRFFRPVIMNVWKNLKQNGHMILNMPHSMYMSIRDLLPPVFKRIDFPIQNRNPSRKKTMKLGRKAHELIYVWKKTI